MTFLVVSVQRERIGSRAAKHRLDEPARLSLSSMVASLQSLPPFHRFTRQVHFSSAVLNFQFARETTEQGNLSPCGQLLQTCLHF